MKRTAKAKQEPAPGPPAVGFALGGGGVRGLAHIGVLQAIEQAGVPIRGIAGSSMGAIVGATFALNPAFGGEIFREIVADLEKTLPARLITDKDDKKSVFDRVRKFIDVERFIVDTVLGWGVLPSTMVPSSITKLVLGKRIEEAKIPLAVVTFDLFSGEKVVFREGPADFALQASSAIPGFFPPLPYEDKLLADGAFVDLVPVGEARKLGVDFVIAVDVDQEGERAEISNGLEAFLRAVEVCARHHKNHHLKLADFVIRPDFGEPIKTFAISKAQLCIEAGARAAEQALPELKRLLQQKGDAMPEPAMLAKGQ